jgi:cytochrome c-type biogenesis protein CcsB
VLFVVAGLVFSRPKASNAAWALTVIAFAAHTAALAARWVAAGHLPYIEDYENILMGTWVVVALYLGLGSRWRQLRAIGVGVLPFVLLSLGVAATLPSAVSPVTAPYKSIWLGVHVTFAWATYAAYTICASLAMLQLMKMRSPDTHPEWLARVPEGRVLEERTVRFVGYGFLVNTVMIASGAIWAHDLWGAYWSWDPVETWSLLTWLAYGFYLHAHYTLGWRGKRLAWTAILALFGVLMSFWGVQFLPSSYHLFRSVGGSAPLVRP